MKEKVIVFGLGSEFINFHKRIEETYEVVAYADNNAKIYGMQVIRPSDICKYEYNKILICSRRYFHNIKIELVTKYEIAVTKIIGLETFDEIDYRRQQKDYLRVINNLETYKQLNSDKRFSVRETDLCLIDSDYNDNAGTPYVHYFAQDIWAARKIYEENPDTHYDIGSSLNGFIAHLLVFRKVNYIDIRPLPVYIPNLNFINENATDLKGLEDNSIESISSLSAIEHFGLGRYGDAIDPEACFKVMRNLVRVVKPGGNIYISVPIGPEDKLVFNAHRIFRVDTILDSFEGTELMEAKIISGSNAYEENLLEKDWDKIADFSCGLFVFKKM